MVFQHDVASGRFAFGCHLDKIAISATDPLINRWATHGTEKIPCPMCNADMRVFFTSTGYMKAKCPKKGCGATIASANTDYDPVTGKGRKALENDGRAPGDGG